MTDGKRVAFDDNDDDDHHHDDDAVVAATTTAWTSTSTTTTTPTTADRAPTRRHSHHHVRTYTPHTESLVGLFARGVSHYGSFVPVPSVDVIDVGVNGGGDVNGMEVNDLLDKDDDEGEDEDEEDGVNGRTQSSWGFTWTSSRGASFSGEEDEGIMMVPQSSRASLDKMLARLRPALLGSLLFPLYMLVFCFAEASAITRPSRPISSGLRSSLLSPMALAACVGSLFSGPMLISVLGGPGDYPALYPCIDMFMAPFLAQMAVDVDEALVRMRPPGGGGGGGMGAEYDDGDDAAAFLATFAALNAFGMMASGLLCALAGRVRLANLAGFLPFPVLCGFFSSVGLSVWLSAFKVDAGTTVGRALADGTIVEKLGRHVPSL